MSVLRQPGGLDHLAAIGDLPAIVLERLEQVLEQVGRVLVAARDVGIERALHQPLDGGRHVQRARAAASPDSIVNSIAPTANTSAAGVGSSPTTSSGAR